MNGKFDITQNIDGLRPLPNDIVGIASRGCGSGSCGCSSGTGGKCSSCGKRATKLDVYNWLSDIPEMGDETKMVEVQFKNTRKGYFLNSNDLELFQGDMVAVEAMPGHDIGYVTLTGKLVQIQMKKNNVRFRPGEQKRIYRLAKQSDIERYEQAKTLEEPTMIRSRQIAESLGLQMKIGDVEYQGDGGKAIFYYIAEGRVDFRQLIKLLAEEFRVRIEMKQIGARQEAGRIGGIGPCGRELCCSSWSTNFISVSTTAARIQDVSLNPQKLAGQCGKLKCCLNYEIDQYMEAYKKLPPKEAVLETLDADFYHFKTDVFAGEITYSTSKSIAANLVTIPKERVFEIIRMNKAGVKPQNLLAEGKQEKVPNRPEYGDLLENESITRFDNEKRKRKKTSAGREGQTPNAYNGNTGGQLRNRKNDKQMNGDGRNKQSGNQNAKSNNQGNPNQQRQRKTQSRPPRAKVEQSEGQPSNNRPQRVFRRKDDNTADTTNS